MIKHCALLLALVLAAPLAHAEDQHVLKIGTVAPNDTPWAKSLKTLKKRIQKDSGGRIKVKIFWSGALGGEKSLVRRTARGEIQAAAVSSGSIATMVPEVGVVELPYLFDSLAEADHVLDNHLFDPMAKLLLEKGFVLHLWSENGYRNFATKHKPIKTPADLKGLKMRSQEMWIHSAWYRALGASPVQIPVPEVMQSLQTNVVDGYDNTLLYAFAVSWYQPVKHITLTRHIYQPAAILYARSFFDGLPKDLQAVLVANRRADIRRGRKGVRALTPHLEKNYKVAGKELHRLSPAELDAFRALAPGVHKDFIAKVPGAKPLLELVKKGKAEFAAEN